VFSARSDCGNILLPNLKSYKKLNPNDGEKKKIFITWIGKMNEITNVNILKEIF